MNYKAGKGVESILFSQVNLVKETKHATCQT